MLAPRAVKRKVIAGKAAAKPSAPSETTADQSMLDMMREEEEYHRQCALNAQELDKLAQSHASTSKAVEVQVEEVDPAEVAKLHAEKLSRLRAVIEETLSDWGLCHNRELLKRLKSSEDGCTPLLVAMSIRERLICGYSRTYIEYARCSSCLWRHYRYGGRD